MPYLNLIPRLSILVLAAVAALGAPAAAQGGNRRGPVPPPPPPPRPPRAAPPVVIPRPPVRIPAPPVYRPPPRNRVPVPPRVVTPQRPRPPAASGPFSKWGAGLRWNGKVTPSQKLREERLFGKKGERTVRIQRHHVIPFELRSHTAIKKSGFNVRGNRNKMFLPERPGTQGVLSGRAVHRNGNLNGVSHEKYNRRTERALDRVARIGEARKWDAKDYEAAVSRILRHNKNYLRVPR